MDWFLKTKDSMTSRGRKSEGLTYMGTVAASSLVAILKSLRKSARLAANGTWVCACEHRPRSNVLAGALSEDQSTGRVAVATLLPQAISFDTRP